MKQAEATPSQGFRITIKSLHEKTLGWISSCVIFCKTDWQQTAKEEFKNYKPGSKKEITVWNGSDKIYEFRNY